VAIKTEKGIQTRVTPKIAGFSGSHLRPTAVPRHRSGGQHGVPFAVLACLGAFLLSRRARSPLWLSPVIHEAPGEIGAADVGAAGDAWFRARTFNANADNLATS